MKAGQKAGQKAAPKRAASSPVAVAEQPYTSPLLLTVEDAARKLGICRDFMYRLLAMPHPRIRSVKIGHARRVPLAELEAYIERLLTDVA